MALETSDRSHKPAPARDQTGAHLYREAEDAFLSLVGSIAPIAQPDQSGQLDLGSVASLYQGRAQPAAARPSDLVQTAVRTAANGNTLAAQAVESVAPAAPAQPFHPFSANDIASAGNNAAYQLAAMFVTDQQPVQPPSTSAVDNVPSAPIADHAKVLPKGVHVATAYPSRSPSLNDTSEKKAVDLASLLPVVTVAMTSPELATDASAANAAAINQIEASERQLGGSAGVQQGGLGDCWFESSVAAVAATPQGRQQLASMIVQNPDKSYTVTFPGDPTHPVNVAASDLDNSQLSDSAGWARVLEAANLKKNPLQAKSGGDPALALHLLTGGDVSGVQTSDLNHDQLGQMLQTALQNGNPVVAGTPEPGPKGLIGNHAYAVLGYDPKTQTVTVLNPWGNNDDHAAGFAGVGQTADGITNLGGGKLTMSLDTFEADYAHVSGLGPKPESLLQKIATPLVEAAEIALNPVMALDQLIANLPI